MTGIMNSQLARFANIIKRFIFVLLILNLFGCFGVSKHPFYIKNQIETTPDWLLGNWNGGDQTVSFDRFSKKYRPYISEFKSDFGFTAKFKFNKDSFELSINELIFSGRLVFFENNGNQYLDLEIRKVSEIKNDTVNMKNPDEVFGVTPHILLRVQLINDVLFLDHMYELLIPQDGGINKLASKLFPNIESRVSYGEKDTSKALMILDISSDEWSRILSQENVDLAFIGTQTVTGDYDNLSFFQPVYYKATQND